MQHHGRMTREERESYLLGRQRFEAGDDRGALETFTLLLESCPRFADVHYMVGLVHERGGDLEAASTSLERALEINPSYAEAVAALVSVYERRGLFERSRELAEQLSPSAGPARATWTPPPAASWRTCTQCWEMPTARPGSSARPSRPIARPWIAAPASTTSAIELGIALREAGLPNHAIGEFKRVLRTHSAYLESAVQLGLTYYTLGRTPQALAEWESVLQRDPSREDAQMYLRMVQAGEIATEL